MTAPAHFLGGAALCRYVRNRPLGLALAFLSHLLFDAVPHFEAAWLLEPWLGGAVGPVRRAMLPWFWVIVGLLAICVWRRFARSGPKGPSTAIYLIAGGFLATLLDILTSIAGRASLIGRINHAGHWWDDWAYHRVDAQRWGPPMALGMIVVELAVAGLSAWLLFRRRPDRDVP